MISEGPVAPRGAFGSRHGGVLLTALIVTLFVTMAVIAATHEVGSRLRSRERRTDGGVAIVAAQAGLENAVDMAGRLESWRSTYGGGAWITQKVLDVALLDVEVSDPGDGLVPIDGPGGSSDADTVRIRSSATVAGLTRSLEADYVPFPDSVLRYVAVAGGDLSLDNVALEGRARSNGDVIDVGNGGVLGDITIVEGNTVDPSLDDADTDVHEVPDPIDVPVVDFAWWTLAGERISVPVTRLFTGVSFSRVSNPFGPVSPEGIYWIDAGGGDVTFRDCGISASIAILDAGDVFISGPLPSLPTFYYHESPDPGRLPALVVEGNLQMAIDGAGNVTLITPLGVVLLASALHGVFYCTGEFDGPQTSSVFRMPADGAFIAGGELYLRGTAEITTIQHDPALSLTALVGFAGRGLRLVRGSTREP